MVRFVVGVVVVEVVVGGVGVEEIGGVKSDIVLARSVLRAG